MMTEIMTDHHRPLSSSLTYTLHYSHSDLFTANPPTPKHTRIKVFAPTLYLPGRPPKTYCLGFPFKSLLVSRTIFDPFI